MNIAIVPLRLQVPQGALQSLEQQYRAAPRCILPPEMLVGVMTLAKLHIPHLLVHLLLHLPKHARAHVTRHAEQDNNSAQKPSQNDLAQRQTLTCLRLSKKRPQDRQQP